MDSILGHLQWSEVFLYFGDNSGICSRDAMIEEIWLV